MNEKEDDEGVSGERGGGSVHDFMGGVLYFPEVFSNH